MKTIFTAKRLIRDGKYLYKIDRKENTVIFYKYNSARQLLDTYQYTFNCEHKINNRNISPEYTYFVIDNVAYVKQVFYEDKRKKNKNQDILLNILMYDFNSKEEITRKARVCTNTADNIHLLQKGIINIEEEESKHDILFLNMYTNEKIKIKFLRIYSRMCFAHKNGVYKIWCTEGVRSKKSLKIFKYENENLKLEREKLIGNVNELYIYNKDSIFYSYYLNGELYNINVLTGDLFLCEEHQAITWESDSNCFCLFDNKTNTGVNLSSDEKIWKRFIDNERYSHALYLLGITRHAFYANFNKCSEPLHSFYENQKSYYLW